MRNANPPAPGITRITSMVEYELYEMSPTNKNDWWFVEHATTRKEIRLAKKCRKSMFPHYRFRIYTVKSEVTRKFYS